MFPFAPCKNVLEKITGVNIQPGCHFGGSLCRDRGPSGPGRSSTRRFATTTEAFPSPRRTSRASTPGVLLRFLRKLPPPSHCSVRLNHIQFENIFGLSQAFDSAETACRGLHFTDFMRAKQQFSEQYTIEDLMRMG